MRSRELFLSICLLLCLSACSFKKTEIKAGQENDGIEVMTYPEDGSTAITVTSYDITDDKLLAGDRVCIECVYPRCGDVPLAKKRDECAYELISGEKLIKDFINGNIDELNIEYIYKDDGSLIDILTVRRTDEGVYVPTNKYIEDVHSSGAITGFEKCECIKKVIFNDREDYYLCHENNTDVDIKNPTFSSNKFGPLPLFSVRR